MATSTGWSGLTDNVYGEAYSTLGGEATLIRKLGKMLKKPGMRRIKELMLTLNGAAAGSAASSTYPRVQAEVDVGNPLVNGGARTIETVTVISANTTAADKTELDNAYGVNTITYPNGIPSFTV